MDRPFVQNNYIFQVFKHCSLHTNTKFFDSDWYKIKPPMHDTEFRGAHFQVDISVSVFDEGSYTACCQNSLHTTSDILNIEWQVTLALFCVTRKLRIRVI
jgi:hypothetical protein